MPLRLPVPLVPKVCFPHPPCGPTPTSGACLSHLLVKHDVPVLHVWLSSGSLGPEREDALPVVLHADDGPVSGLRCVERLVQPADEGVVVASPFALGIGVVHEERQASPLPAVVHWSISRSPSALPNAAMGRRPMCAL